MSKVKQRPSHPLRRQAVKMLMRGEATPAEIRQALQVSRQLIYYWCCEAGLRSVQEARRVWVQRRLLTGVKPSAGPEPEHPAVLALRTRLGRPRPSRDQIRQAKDVKDHAHDPPQS